MLFVARIDALRRIANGKVTDSGETRIPLQDRQAFVFDRARINSRLVDNYIAALYRPFWTPT